MIENMHGLERVKPLPKPRALTGPAACKMAPFVGVAGGVVPVPFKNYDQMRQPTAA